MSDRVTLNLYMATDGVLHGAFVHHLGAERFEVTLPATLVIEMPVRSHVEPKLEWRTDEA